MSTDTGIQLTNGDLYTKTVRAAQNLQRLDLEKSDVIAVLANNSHHVAPIIFAALCLGCPINTLDTISTKPEMMNMLRITNPKVVFCDVSAYEVVSSSLQDVGNYAEIYTFGGYRGKSIAVEEMFAEPSNKSDYR